MATLDARLKLFDLPLRGLPGAWSGETMSSHARSGRKRLWRSDLIMYDVDDLTSAEGAQLVPFHHLRVQVRFLRAREAADGHTTHKGADWGRRARLMAVVRQGRRNQKKVGGPDARREHPGAGGRSGSCTTEGKKNNCML